MTTNIIQKEYEILYIIKPHLSEEVYKENCGKFEEMVNGEEGKIDYIEPQGVRDLATPIKKFNQGFYVESKFLATPEFCVRSQMLVSISRNASMVVIQPWVQPLSIHHAPQPRSALHPQCSKRP